MGEAGRALGARLRTVPWWMQGLLAVAAIALGVVMAFHATMSMRLLGVLVAVGLVVMGVAGIVTRPGDQAAWLRLVFGLGLAVAGAVMVAWRGTTVALLAVVIAVALVVDGVLDIVEAAGERGERRLAGVLSGAWAIVLGVVTLAWPRLSVFVVGVLFGAWLVFTGLRLLVTAVATARGQAPSSPPEQGSRGWLRVARSAGALALALVLLGGTLLLHRGDPTIVPDAFYTPPAGVPAEPGVLIRSEPWPPGVGEGQQGWRILYTTTDGAGTPAVASGTVRAPTATSTQRHPVLAVAHGTTGVVPGCAPSLATDPYADGSVGAIGPMVDRGWVAVTSDYVGLGTRGPHAYLMGPPAAANVLDAVTAAGQVPGLDLSDQVVVWGHSQGGHAALWTGLRAADLAPELDLLGVAALAPAADLTRLAEGVKDTAIGKVVTAYIAQSWSQVHGFPLKQVVAPGYAPVVRGIAGNCFTGRDVLASFATSTQLTGRIVRDEALEGELGDLLVANTPAGSIDVPVLVAQGGADPLILPTAQRAFLAAWCAQGQPIDYREFPDDDHVSLVAEESALTDELIQWTTDRLDGAPAGDTCADLE